MKQSWFVKINQQNKGQLFPPWFSWFLKWFLAWSPLERSLCVLRRFLCAFLVLSTTMIGSHVGWGQALFVQEETLPPSASASKVFLEIDHLINLAERSFKKHFNNLSNEAAKRDILEEETLGATPTRVNPADTLEGNTREVARLPDEDAVRIPLSETPTQVLEPIFTEPGSTLYKEEVVLVSLNAYVDKERKPIADYLSESIEGLTIDKFPQFSVYKDDDFFQFAYTEEEEKITFSYGPQNNQSITEQLRQRGRNYYMRVYFFRLAEKSVLDINVYDSETHEVVWGDRFSIYIGFQDTSLTYRFTVGVGGTPSAGILLTNFLGVRLPVIGLYGIFVTFGLVAIDPVGSSQYYYNFSAATTQLFVITVGPQISYSLNEIFRLNYRCCEFLIDIQLGYESRVILLADEEYLIEQGTLQQKFVGIIGLSVSIRRFIIYGNFDILNPNVGAGVGFNF